MIVLKLKRLKLSQKNRKRSTAVDYSDFFEHEEEQELEAKPKKARKSLEDKEGKSNKGQNAIEDTLAISKPSSKKSGGANEELPEFNQDVKGHEKEKHKDNTAENDKESERKAEKEKKALEKEKRALEKEKEKAEKTKEKEKEKEEKEKAKEKRALEKEKEKEKETSALETKIVDGSKKRKLLDSSIISSSLVLSPVNSNSHANALKPKSTSSTKLQSLFKAGGFTIPKLLSKKQQPAADKENIMPNEEIHSKPQRT